MLVVPVGGSAHFPPNARGHYDLDNDKPVLCTMADWRIGSGKGGKDKAEPYTRANVRNYRDLAPDCMGGVARLLAAVRAGAGQQAEGRR